VKDDTLETLHAFNERMKTMPARRAVLIEEAREAGHTWREIADVMGITEHGAIKASKPSAARGRPKKNG
jgi:DNA-directed RNA polymerase specialized sigma24 family protein